MILGKKLEQTVFILSTGRTATKALAQYFDECYDDVTARHEPAPSRVLRVASHMRLAGHIGPEALRRLIVMCRYPAVERLKGGTYLEANWYLHGCIDVLEQAFHNVRVVHVTRDPRTYIASMMNFSHLNRMKAIAAPRLPYWLLKPEHLPGTANRSWREMAPPEHYAWLWTAMNTQLDRGAEIFGSRYLHLRYEDIFGDDMKGLERLADWLGLEVVPELVQSAATNKVHASHDRGFPATAQLDSSMRGILETYCGELMSRYGYELPES